MALSLAAWLDVASVRPDGETRAHLVVEVTADEEAPSVEGARMPATTVLAIDVSGSMHGDPLDHVVRSVDRLLDALRPEDSIAVVAFSDGATRVVEPVAVDGNGKRLVRQRVARLFAEGHTNVEAGLDLAAEMLKTRNEGRRGVILLSDGHPNVGASTSEALREVVKKHRPSISFSSLGYGVNHAEDVLAAVGDAGGGGYDYVPDPATCARAFAKALGAQADVVAGAIEIAFAPSDGVEIVKLLGGEPTRFGKHGLTVELPDMVPGAKRIVVAEVRVLPPGKERFLAPIARATLAWKRPGTSGPGESVGVDIGVEVADREPTSRREGLVRVMLVRADRVREEARALGDRAQWMAAASLLRKLLAEIDRVPGYVAGDGSALADAYELLVDEAMAYERRPSAETYANFRKSATGSKLAAPAPPPSTAGRGPASSRFLEHTAGSYPEAYLEVNGKRHRLKDECIIGRSADAHLPIVSDAVSRRHAEVYALEGEFWVCDLGSTNPTMVNGEPVLRAPKKLADGDVIRVGGVEIRYEQPKKKS